MSRTEAGVSGFDVVAWNGLYAPAGTPQDVIDTLTKALHEVLADPALKKRALDLGIDARASSPGELDHRMRSDIWGAVIANAHIPKQCQKSHPKPYPNAGLSRYDPPCLELGRGNETT